MAAHTFTRSGNHLTIIPVGDGDWNSKTETDAAGYFPNGMRIEKIQFYGTATDVLKIRNIGATGASIIKAQEITGQGFALDLDARVRDYPYLAIADCTFDTPASVEINITFRLGDGDRPDEL